MASVPTRHASPVLPRVPESKNPSDTNNRRHKADPYAFILHGSREIVPVTSSGDVLCASCSKIHSMLFDRTIVAETSTVGAILSNWRCPSCRLITHCIKPLGRARSILPESQVVLLLTPLSFDEPTGRQGKHVKKVSRNRVEIRLCTKNPKSEEEVKINESDIIGVFLPVKDDESSNTARSTGHNVLFNTLKYQDSVHARPITYTVDVKLLRTWMDFCTTSHSFCRTTKTPSDRSIDIRLIDVVERCLVDATLDEEYIALSYVWGPGNNKVLVKNTLKHLQEKGSLTPSIAPRLVADVMDFIAEIGERYLWVDTACIVQDDPLDKQRQLPNMSFIYAHAKLTIVAAVEGANSPLPRWNKCHHEVSAPTELIQGITHKVVAPPLVAALKQTTWNKRGWTFQEAFLARRLLVFTEDLVYWSCREESWCEDQYTEFHDVKNEPTPGTSLFGTHVEESLCDGKASLTRLCPMGLYAKYAHIYSQRSFSNYSDVVWAFLGILSVSKQQFPNGYIWALPYDQLDAALLWIACCERTQCAEHQYDLSAETRLPIPSWCWIGKGHKIGFLTGKCETKSRVTWHKPMMCWSSGVDTVDDNQELLHHFQAARLSDLESTTEKDVIFDYAFLHFTAQTTKLSIELASDPMTLKNFTAFIRNERADVESHRHVFANIFLPSKGAIHEIMVPARIFRNNTQQMGEFVLLSEYPGEIDKEIDDFDVYNASRLRSGEICNHEGSEDDIGSPHQKEEEASGNASENDQSQKPDNTKNRSIPIRHQEGCSHHPALNLMLIEWDSTQKIKNFARRVAITRIDPWVWKEVETIEKTIVLG